jgi:hypothetical protein
MMEVQMKEEILAQIRSFVFPDVCSKVSAMIDQYQREKHALLKDQIEHLTRALSMIKEVPNSAEGAKMARGLAEEAISVISAEQ